MRQLFRKEHTREQEEISVALASVPASERAASEPAVVPAPVTQSPAPSEAVAVAPSPPPQPSSALPPTVPDQDQSQKSGFWARFMKRKR